VRGRSPQASLRAFTADGICKLHKVPPRGPLVQLLEALSEEDVLETADLEAIQKALNEIGG
jgi:hypothetical protein